MLSFLSLPLSGYVYLFVKWLSVATDNCVLDFIHAANLNLPAQEINLFPFKDSIDR